MKARRFVRLNAAVCSMMLLSALFPVAAGAAASGGIGGRPAHPDPSNPRTQSIFIYTLKQGESTHDQVLVSNNTVGPQTINLYAVDGEVTNTGAYTCKQQSEATEDLGGWIKLASTQVTLGSGENKAIDFTVSMPTTADVGEHDACLVFENANDYGATSGSVRIHTRQAIRVVATVPGDLHRSIDIIGFTALNKGSGQQFTLSLHNSGNVSADVDSQVTLTSVFGSTLYKNGGSYPVLPNQKLDLTFISNVQPFFGGWYWAQSSISYGKNPGTLGTDPSGQLVHKSSDRKLLFIMPSPLCGLLVLLGIVALIAWFVWRKHQKQNVASWKTYTVKPGITLDQIARATHSDWRRIARVNHLKAPYTLEAGTKLRVPSSENAALTKQTRATSDDSKKTL